MENVSLPRLRLPLPIGYRSADGKEPDNEKLLALVRNYCEEYFAREVAPHWRDAWVDHSKTKVGYEIPITQTFYLYRAPRPLENIEADIRVLEEDIRSMLRVIA